jgi:hypothetical protein
MTSQQSQPSHIANTILLHASNPDKAKAEIADLGGRVTQVLAPNVLLATFPEGTDTGKLQLQLQMSTLDIPNEVDDSARLAIEAWQSRVNRVPDEHEKKTEGLPWDAEGFDAPMKLSNEDIKEDADSNTVAVSGKNKWNNDVLVGNVAVGLVMVDSTGPVKFTDAEIKDLIGQAQEGTQFLTSCEPAADITFTWENHHVTVPGELKVPSTTMTSGLSAVVWNKKLYAFHQGTGDTTRIWYNVWNGKTWEGNGGVPDTTTAGTISAVVYKNNLYCFHQGAGSAKEQVRYNVWDGHSWKGDQAIAGTTTTSGISTVVYKDKLYVFHQGSGGASTRIYYNVHDGSKWLGNEEVPGTPTDSGISAVVCENKIFLIHQGSGNEKSVIRFNSFDGNKWKGDQKIDKSDTGSSLSAVVQNNDIFCFHRGSGKNSEFLKFYIYRSGSWIGDFTVADVRMSGNPSVAVFDNKTVCLHAGSGSSSNVVLYRVFEGMETGNKYDALESIWRNPALTMLGYQHGWRGLEQFTNDLCTNYKTTRAYVIFITKFSQAWAGYTKTAPPCVYIQYYNDGWGHANIYRTLAHETGHVFGAADEYGSANCHPAGKYKVKNGNGNKCTSHQVKCVMNANELEMCDYTKGQLGWLPRSGVFVSYQSSAKDEELWYEMYDGKAWWTARQIPDTATTWSPSAVEYNKKIYCFHHGKSNGQLWYNVFDGANWSGDAQVPNTDISAAPSSVVYNGRIYCFYQGANSNGQLHYNVFDGHSWAGDKQVSNTKLTESPSAVVYKKKLFCFHRGTGKGELWYNVFDGSRWGNGTRLSDDGITDAPSAVNYEDSIFCFYQGPNSNGKLLYTVYNGPGWSADIQVPATTLSKAPSAMVYNNSLYCFHLSGDGNEQLRYNTYNGSKWAGDSILPKKGIPAGPMATAATFPG